MRVLVDRDGPDDREAVEAAVQRAGHMAAIVSLAILGLAGVYFAALYLIAH